MLRKSLALVVLLSALAGSTVFAGEERQRWEPRDPVSIIARIVTKILKLVTNDDQWTVPRP